MSGSKPKKTTSLSDRQDSFIYNLVCLGNNPTQSARLAGYLQPKQSAFDLTRNVKVIARIQQMRQKVFSSDLATTAVTVLRDVMLNSSTDSARVSACRTVLELSGDFARAKNTSTDKDLAELTPEELSGMIGAWEEERAKVKSSGTVKVVESSTA